MINNQGYSIYLLIPNSTSSISSGVIAAINRIRFLLTRPYLALLSRDSAFFLRTFMHSGELSFLALAASSRNITSSDQCRLFSIAQWLLTALANSFTSVRVVMKYLVCSRTASFSYTMFFASPTAFSPFHSLRPSSHEMSVRSLYSLRPYVRALCPEFPRILFHL